MSPDFLTEVRSDFALVTQFWLYVLVAMTILDILFGVTVAFAAGKLCSTVSRLGMARKILMLATVLVAALFDGLFPKLDRLMELSFWGFDVEWRIRVTIGSLVAGIWCICEFVSITEKGGLLGLPMPQRLSRGFVRLGDALDGQAAVKLEAVAKVTTLAPGDVEAAAKGVASGGEAG